MTSNSLFFTFFILFITAISIIYLNIYRQNRKRYLLYLGISWLIYVLSISFLLAGYVANNPELISLRILFDMGNILLLLYATYSFAGVKPSSVWIRFSLYISIWVILGVSFDFQIMSTYLPTVVYQTVLSVLIVITIARHWNTTGWVKVLLCMMFLLWGFGKTFVSIAAINHMVSDIFLFYIGEILYSNVLNLALFMIVIKRTQTRLLTAEQTFRTITENASDIFILVEPGGSPELKYISPSINTILGVPEETVYNDTHSFVTFLHPDDWKTFDYLFSRKNRLRERTAKVRAFDVDGNLHWCEVTAKRVSDNSGVNFIEGIVRDITSTQEAHDQMLQAKKSRDTLLSYVSHELKTPIVSILGFSTALRDNMNLDENQKNQMLDIIYSKSVTLNKLITDLVQLSKMETHQFSFEFYMSDCKSVADELWQRHEFDGNTSGVEILREPDSPDLEDFYLIIDIDRIDQVYTNILSNGLRYVENDKRIIVRFYIDKLKANFVFTITNFGKVIEEADRLHLFDRFYRVEKGHQSANEINSGLGLTLSKEIVEAHKGSIEVTSDQLKGTTFKVTIPLYEERTH